MRKAVEEFQVLTARAGARAEAGAKAAARPAGARAKNEWHGRVFEYFRNDFLDALPHEVRQRGGSKSLLRRNQFGFSLAGPVVVPKVYDGRRSTFFSLSYEGTRERIARAFLSTIPTAAQRSGDFSDLVDKAGQPVPIFDPASTAANPGHIPSQAVSRDNLQFSRSPFPDNRIPASRLDSVASSALAYYPLPNAAVGPFLRNNYFVNTPESSTPNGVLAKLDHQVFARHTVNIEAARSIGFYGIPRIFPTVANPGRPDRHFDTKRLEVGDTFARSPNSIFTVSFAASSDGVSTMPDRAGQNLPQALGLKGVSGDDFPSFRLPGYLGLGAPRGSVLDNQRNTFSLNNGLSLKWRRHTIAVTSNLSRHQVNTFQPEYPSGSFLFSSGLSSLPGVKNTGSEFASLLLGLAESAEVSQVLSPSYFRRTVWQAGLRDEYDLQTGLTASVGLNLDFATPRVEKYDRQSTVDLGAINPANGRPGALVFAGRDGRGRAFQPVGHRLEPRLGLAWNPFRRRTTVVRARYARTYLDIPLYTGQFGTQGFNGTPTLVASNPQLEPAVRLQDGLPPASSPVPDLTPTAANETFADLIEPSGRQPVVQQVSIAVDRQLPGDVALTVGAYTSTGRDMLVGETVAGLNAIHPDALVHRDLLNDEAFRSSLRPYPHYKGFELSGLYPLGRYRRDTGYLRVEKRSSRGLALQGYYEFSKQMDDYSGGVQDYFNRSNEWSLTSHSRPHRFQLNYLYELPLGAGKRLLDTGGVIGRLVAGWSISGATLWLSGDPVTLRPEFNNTGGVVRFLRVNTVSAVNPGVANPGPEGWFNPAAFVEPPDFSLGDASRSHATLRNPSFQNHDLSLVKRVSLSSERTIEFLVEGFNFLNHANWNDPDPVIGPAESPNLNAGKIIGSYGGRVVQLGLRFNF